MAEAFGLAANIVSVIHITTEVIKRLNDFKKTVDGIPRALQAISNELPTLTLALKRINQAGEEGRIPEDSSEALRPLLQDMEVQIGAIAEIIDKMRPKDPSRVARNFKAVASFRYDDEIRYREGVIRGYASTLSLERVVTGPGKDLAALRPPLVPTIVCPFGQDPDFVERALLADLIAQRGPGSRRALVGGGGMGKSQLAISYGHKVHQASPDTWVFWVNAGTTARFEQDYRKVANTLRVAGRNDKDADILTLVHDWLGDTRNGDWVMILDNADDKDILTSHPSACRQSQPEKQLRDFLPQSSNGSILVTSRSRDAANLVTCNYKHIFAVEPMTEGEALALMQSQVDETHNEDEMKALLKTLGYVPLAIVQAAANISRRSLPISEYMQELQKGNEFSAGLLDESSPQLRRESERSNSIVATWKVTFEYVRRDAPSAARLLSLMCLFDCQEIPETFLEGRYGEEIDVLAQKHREAWWRRRPHLKRKEQPMKSEAQPCDFEDDWLMLRDLSLIKPNKDRRHFSMHVMVQFATRKWLNSQGNFVSWSFQYLSIISTHFPFPKRGLQIEEGPLLAHAYAAVPYRPSDTATRPLQDWATITFGVATYYDQHLAWERALKLFFVAAEAFEIALGWDAQQSLECNRRIGDVYSLLGRKSEAEKMYRRLFSFQSEISGMEHKNTLETMVTLANTLASLGRDSEAEKLYQENLQTHIRILGPSHSDTQQSFAICGMFYEGHKRDKDAYNIYRQAHEARTQSKSNCFDPTWASQMKMMGIRLLMSGDLKLAEVYQRKALTEFEKNASDHEQDLISCITSLGRNLIQQKSFVEAETHYQRALKWYDTQDASKLEEKIETMTEYAHVLGHLDKLDAAEQLARDSLAKATEKYASDHIEFLFIMWVLGVILARKDQHEEALRFLKQAYQDAIEKQGEQHPDTKMYEADYIKLVEKLEKLGQPVLEESTEHYSASNAANSGEEVRMDADRKEYVPKVDAKDAKSTLEQTHQIMKQPQLFSTDKIERNNESMAADARRILSDGGNAIVKMEEMGEPRRFREIVESNEQHRVAVLA